ncbi:unnamed protein product [Cladocopium goreaui]|uniref:non-specific serine/threonine protein kinase n=1 Tax=Cladocopium goreaui TaxID=2562237 RepID=A0A9P1GMS5_9DINO|nr:unnamed protein product [Cladocopium goreaui]
MTCQNDFEFGPQLGRGSFGVVFQVRRKEDGVTCVCKQIALNEMNRKARLEAHREVELLRKVSSGCSFIVQYLGSFLEGDSLHIIMEFCERGDLSQHLRSCHRGLEERTVWRYLLQIGSGLLWRHQNRILHRDIKTLNVFLKTNDDVRLGDLGVARVLSNTNFASTFVGTPYYLSPEICEEKPYNELSDVWAFGCVVYEMCTLRHPFEAKNQAALLIKILRGQFAPIDTKYSEDLRELIDGCMQREPIAQLSRSGHWCQVGKENQTHRAFGKTHLEELGRSDGDSLAGSEVFRAQKREEGHGGYGSSHTSDPQTSATAHTSSIGPSSQCAARGVKDNIGGRDPGDATLSHEGSLSKGRDAQR